MYVVRIIFPIKDPEKSLYKIKKLCVEQKVRKN